MRSLAILAVLLLAAIAPAQEHTKRLILKDGSYQSITDYKIEGDRVHYRSAERFEWEDLPKDLVDWDATNKFNANPVKNDRSREEREKIEATTAEEAVPEDVAPTVAPGLRLPESTTGGVFLLDNFKGRPELAEIVQSGADLAPGSKKDALHVALGSSRKPFALEGVHAHVQSHVTSPVIFICIESGAKPVNLAEHYRLIRALPDPKKNTRLVGTMVTKLNGKSHESQTFVPATASMVNKGAWVKLTPNQPLEPGEYAVVEMLGENESNQFVWDFGVNPAAPENIGPKLPENP